MDADTTGDAPVSAESGTAMLRLVSDDGDSVVVNSPVYPPFYSSVEHMNRTVVESPRDDTHRIDLAALEDSFQTVTANKAAPSTYCATRTTPPERCTLGRSWLPSLRWRTGTGSASTPTRSTHRASFREPGSPLI